MIKRIITLMVMAGILTGGFCAKEVSAKNNSLQIKGSDTMVNLVQAWAEEFMKKNPDSFVAVTGGGSGTGFAALVGGSCDVAMSSRQIKPQEIGLAEAKNVHPVGLKVALDGLAVVVNPKNPVSKLTIDQLAWIFTGKIKNWKEVGGPDLKVVILSREVNSGTHVYFKEHVLRHSHSTSPATKIGGSASGGKEEYSPDALLLPSSQAIADEVAQNTGAIGYYGMGYISKRQKAILVAKDASSEYVHPTADDVLSGKYPISRPLFIYTKGEPGGDVKKFVDFLLSDEGQAVVSSMDFVPLKK